MPRHDPPRGQAFIVALGVDLNGDTRPLGFWDGATANHELCEALLADVERRGLKLSKRVLDVTDGGTGLITAVKARHGKTLGHQRGTSHTERTSQRPLPKRSRQDAHRRYRLA